MATFNNGTTDTLSSNFLNSIKWQFRHGRLCGTCESSPLVEAYLEKEENGRFEVISPTIGGEQTTVIDWFRRDGDVEFRIFSVSKPS